MTDTLSMEQLHLRGLNYEIADAVDKAVENAVRSPATAAQSRPQGIGQRLELAGGVGWIGVDALIAAYTSTSGVVFGKAKASAAT